MGSLAIISCLGRSNRGASETPVASHPVSSPANDEYGTSAPWRSHGYSPIVSPPHVAAQAAPPTVGDLDDVLGVELGGECRAYPVDMLSIPPRHVLNDTLGGQEIAVTWCGRTLSVAVFARNVASKTLTLAVSGKLIHENVVLVDLETGSEWPQLRGEAISGPLKGNRLNLIPSVCTNWKTWHVKHPETTVLNLSSIAQGGLHDPADVGGVPEKKSLTAFQWGLAREGMARSWPLAELAHQPVLNDSFMGLALLLAFDAPSRTLAAFDRRLGDAELTFRQESHRLVDQQTGTVWDPVTGRAIEGALAGRRLKLVAGNSSLSSAWRTFYPASDVHTPK